MTKPIITVFCATGRQGRGAVKALLAEGTYAVRAVTRNPDSDSAKALAKLGAEVVKADFDDKDSIYKVTEGSYGVFGITDFWTSFHAEEGHGKLLVDAAKAAGVKHFVWSTLDHSDLKVPHWETKANVDDYLKESGVPRTSLYTAWFYENIDSQFFGVKRDQDGSLILDVPYATDGPIPAMLGEDCGTIAAVLFKDPEQYIGKDVHATVEVTTPRKIAKLIENVVGEPIKIKEISFEEFDALKGRVWDELWTNLKWFYLYHTVRDVPFTNKILPTAVKLQDWIQKKPKEEWLASAEERSKEKQN